MTQKKSNLNQKHLTDFNLDLAGSDTQYATHGMHTWLAAMIPGLANWLINRTSAKKLLDPFCGGGAVCVEGVLHGLLTAGTEINPLGIMVTKAKTTYIEKEPLLDELEKIRSFVKCYEGPIINFPKAYMINYWFKPYMFRPLSGLAEAVNQIKNDKIKTFYQCVLSATVRDVSLTYRNEIRLRKLEPEKIENFRPDVIERFIYRAQDSIERLQSLPSNGSDARIELGNVMDLPFEDDEFTTIVCSPPYSDERNGVPYFQFSKNMLFWLGWSREEVLRYKEQTLGWVGKRKEIEIPPSKTLKHLLDLIKDNERACLEAKAFYQDYFKALREMARVTTDKIAIVIAQRVLAKTYFDNAKITIELFEKFNIKCQEHYKRSIPSKRLPLLTDYGGGGMKEEHILIFGTHNKSLD